VPIRYNTYTQCIIGDEVVIVGQQNGEQITIEEIAKRNKTISTDVIFQIGNRIPKFYKEIL